MSIPFSVAQAAKQKNADETTNFEACSNSLQKQLLSLRQGTVESGAAARAWGQRRGTACQASAPRYDQIL